MSRTLHHLLFILILFNTSSVVAEIVELKTAERLTTQATFLEGDNDANPIMILHGFLQTREFPTINRLTTSLNESGHTVLAPSLTLGIHKRKKSLDCEAIHTHNTESDTAEVAQWVEWLSKKTGKPVILIGHSAGTQTLLNYMTKYENQPVEKVIFISMIHFGKSGYSHETPELAERARAKLASGFNALDTYALSFCKTYPTRAADFLSYYEWDSQKFSDQTKIIRDKLSVIIGTGDKRIPADWRKQLAAINLHVVEIEGANHFFDQAHEFDLLDAVENLLVNN